MTHVSRAQCVNHFLLERALVINLLIWPCLVIFFLTYLWSSQLFVEKYACPPALRKLRTYDLPFCSFVRSYDPPNFHWIFYGRLQVFPVLSSCGFVHGHITTPYYLPLGPKCIMEFWTKHSSYKLSFYISGQMRFSSCFFRLLLDSFFIFFFFRSLSFVWLIHPMVFRCGIFTPTYFVDPHNSSY